MKKILAPINATPQEFYSWLVEKYSQISHSYWLHNGHRLYLMGVGDLVTDEIPKRIEIRGRQVPDYSINGEIKTFPVFTFEFRSAGKGRVEITAISMIDQPDLFETIEFLISMLRISYPEKVTNENAPVEDNPKQNTVYQPGRPSKKGYDVAFDRMKNDGLTIERAFSWWRINFPNEALQFDNYPTAMKGFRQAMNRRRSKKTRNS